MMKNNNFCAFILSHGRADRVCTYDLLRKRNYTGIIRLVVDDEDEQLGDYRKRYGDEVIVFNKAEIANECDEFDNFKDRRSPLYARNYCWKLANILGVKYFIQLDDDYVYFHYRFNIDGVYTSHKVNNIDAIFDILIDFLEVSGACSVALAQGGDFMGGIESGTINPGITPKRKAMNTWLCSTERPFQFLGKFNDDVNTYVNLGSKGILFFTITQISIEQKATQKNPGGITECYLDHGTYVKSFYTILCNPSSVKIITMGRTDRRLHHKILWKYTVPKIISDRYRKEG